MNMTEMAFALGLQDKIVGLTGITGWYKTSPTFDQERGDIPELAPKYPTVENLVAASPDLFFAGWYYGMKPGVKSPPTRWRPSDQDHGPDRKLRAFAQRSARCQHGSAL